MLSTVLWIPLASLPLIEYLTFTPFMLNVKYCNERLQAKHILVLMSVIYINVAPHSSLVGDNSKCLTLWFSPSTVYRNAHGAYEYATLYITAARSDVSPRNVDLLKRDLQLPRCENVR